MSSLDDLLAQLTGGDESLAEAASTELARCGESVFPALEALLESSDADHRWWAVRTLAQMDSPRVECFARALDDESPEVREGAALALAAHPAEEAAPVLVKALSDEDSIVASLAVNALAAIGKSTVPILLDSFQAASPRARIQMMRAFAEIRDPRAIPIMLKATEADSALLNYWAQEGLERLGLNMVYIKPQ